MTVNEMLRYKIAYSQLHNVKKCIFKIDIGGMIILFKQKTKVKSYTWEHLLRGKEARYIRPAH
jgi:hypothetical protein